MVDCLIDGIRSVKVQDVMVQIGCVVGWYTILHQFLDNSDSPSIVEQ